MNHFRVGCCRPRVHGRQRKEQRVPTVTPRGLHPLAADKASTPSITPGHLVVDLDS
jgi:hypothetical protein